MGYNPHGCTEKDTKERVRRNADTEWVCIPTNMEKQNNLGAKMWIESRVNIGRMG
jgi:hypothetical protein